MWLRRNCTIPPMRGLSALTREEWVGSVRGGAAGRRSRLDMHGRATLENEKQTNDDTEEWFEPTGWADTIYSSDDDGNDITTIDIPGRNINRTNEEDKKRAVSISRGIVDKLFSLHGHVIYFICHV